MDQRQDSVAPLLDLTDNPYQKDFVFSPYKYTGYYGGVRNGKTWGGCYRGILLSEMFPNNVGVVGRLTYGELRDTTQKDFLSFVRKRNGGTLNPGPYVKKWLDAPTLTLTLYNDSIIMFRYAENPETFLSMTLGWYYLDQAEFIPEQINNHLEDRLSLWGPTNVAASKAKYQELHKKPMPYEPKEFGFISGNPAPGWVFDKYKKNPKGIYHLIEAPTEANVKNLPPQYLADFRARHTDEWIAKYLMGNWDTFEGQIYKEYAKGIHVVSEIHVREYFRAEYVKRYKKEPDEGWNYIPEHWPRHLGWDHGQRHPTAVEFVGIDEEGNCLVYNEYYKSDPVIRRHAENVLALCEGDNVPRPDNGKGVIVWMSPDVKGDYDPEGHDFLQLYQDFGIHGMPANNRVLAGIQKIQLLLHPDPKHQYPRWHPKAGQLGAPRLYFIGERCPGLLHELPLYHWETEPEGEEMKEKERPHKYLDDGLDSLRYALMGYLDNAKPAVDRSKDPSYQEYVLAEVLGINQKLKDNIWDE